MDEPLSEWTLLAEYFANCRDGTGCRKGCQAAEDTNVPDKPDKPRLAEVLGVEVDKKFRISGSSDRFWVDKYGVANAEKMGDEDAAVWVMFAINHPNNIVRSCLTEAELAICKAVGAKWVSRDNGLSVAVLWMDKPHLTDSGYEGGTVAAEIYGKHFLCVRPGDCICVEEAGGK